MIEENVSRCGLYVAREVSDLRCDDCAGMKERRCSDLPPCQSETRKDKKNVIFVNKPILPMKGTMK